MKTKKQFLDLLHLAKTMRQKSDWHREQTIEKWTKFIIEEAAEIRHAAKKKDWDELHEEIGDMMWDLVFLSQLAKEQRLFTIHDSVHSAHQKIIRRHPNIFGDKKNKRLTKNELNQLYNQIKQEEKMEKRLKK